MASLFPTEADINAGIVPKEAVERALAVAEEDSDKIRKAGELDKLELEDDNPDEADDAPDVEGDAAGAGAGAGAGACSPRK